MKERFNFAVVGCGRVSARHLQPLAREIEGAALVAVCDVQADRAQRAAADYNVSAYTSYHEMLAKHPEIDVVNVLTPSGLHDEHVCDIAQYGKHVVVEKPMALTIEGAERMIDAAAQAGKRLFVVQQNRFNLPIVKLREAVEARRFGKLVLGTVRVRWCRTQSYYDQDDWRGTWAMDGGVLANQASHHIDLLIWLMGEVESVFAYTATRLVDIEADDTAVVAVRFVNGALGVIEATTATRPKDLEGSISILGEYGSVEIGGFAMNDLKVWNFRDPVPDDHEVMTHYRENPPDVYGFGHKRYLADVVQSLRTGRDSAVDGREGLRSLTLINAMYESKEAGREVRLKFRPEHAKLGKRG